MPLGRTVTALGVVALLLGLGVSQVRRDTAPPELFIEVADRVPADIPFSLFISANESVRYYLGYGAFMLEEVSQDLEVSLQAAAGTVALTVIAEDSAGNRTSAEVPIHGVPEPELALIASLKVLPGDPIAAWVTWEPAGAVVGEPSLTLDRALLRLLPTATEGAAFALASVPLGSEAGTIALTVSLRDEFERLIQRSALVTIEADPQPIEQLNVSSATLAVVTPEGRELERQALDHAFLSPHPNPLWQRAYIVPIDGRGTSGFGTPRRYAPGGRVSYHLGTDIAAPGGTPVQASNDGVVVVAAFFPIKGGLVILDHGVGVTSLYLHQSRLHVAVGDEVERGQVIGEVGSTGLSTGPHLHWEVRLNGVPTNPLAWVGRALPLGTSDGLAELP